jgi:2-polyprenyl-3-methyl-5-hydroxy-6-metoxy-1,4-benzoquinol methylase
MTDDNKIINCLVCKQSECEKIAQRKCVGIFKCSNCGITFAVGEEKRSNVDTVIDTDPRFYETARIDFNEQLRLAKKILPHRIREYEKRLASPCKRILEIGCGTGAYAKAFDELGIQYTAVELDPEIAKFARQNTQSNIVNLDFTKFECEERFDVVFASQVFEHILEPDICLKKVKDLAGGGLLHFDVPNHQSLIALIRKFMSKTEYGFIQPPYHMVAYTPDVLSQRLQKNGFRDIQTWQLPNDHKTWGQLTANSGFLSWISYRVAQLMQRGSLLTAIAKIPD